MPSLATDSSSSTPIIFGEQDSEASLDSTNSLVHANLLIDNDVGRELNARKTGPRLNAPWNFETFIARGLPVDNEGHVTPVVTEDSRRRSVITRLSSFTPMWSIYRVCTNQVSDRSTEGVPPMSVQKLLREFLHSDEIHGSATSRSMSEEQYKTLARVVRTLFNGAENGVSVDDEVQSTISSSTVGSSTADSTGLRYVRYVCRKVTESQAWTSFFMTLTIYLLFGPDLGKVFGNREHDDGFAVVNSYIFFLFSIEFACSVIGQSRYLCSLLSLLDLLALFSILVDTSLIGNIEIVDERGQYVSRLARSSRMTRLARIARIARVTRLIPQIMRMCRHEQRALAKILYTRRLWRVFLFFAMDGMGSVSTFDFKCFYLTLMQEVSLLEATHMIEVLTSDVRFLSTLPAIVDNKDLSWSEFSQTVLSTELGKNMTKTHERDVEQDEGVWSLTRKLSDNTALKVCIGIMTLVGLMALIDDNQEDISVKQSLAMLDAIARAEHSSPTGDREFLCNQISLFTQSHNVIFLFLDGFTYWDNGRCLAQDASVSEPNPSRYADFLVEESLYRSNDIIRECWPPGADCEKAGNVSLALVVTRHTVQDLAQLSCVTTLSLIVLLLVFVFILSRGIAKFSKTMLQPLRSISDDMTALACTDLVHIDAEPPELFADVDQSIKVADELSHLQTSFKAMRSAIRSWSKFVPPVVVQRLFQAGIEATIGVTRCYATVLFVDIADFETVCCGISPHELLALMSNVLDKIAEIIKQHNGTLLEFIGDEVVAVFNIPNPVKNHVSAAISSAAEIHAAVQNLSITRDGKSGPIRCRCGVHSANVLVGNIGSSKRMKYGVLGDGVNLTARLKGLNARYKTLTLASDVVVKDDNFKRRFISRPVDLVAVKGKKEPTTVYEIMHSNRKDDLKWRRQVAGRHDVGFKLYLEREFEEASAVFQDVEDMFEEEGFSDTSSRMLQSRCDAYIKHPPPEDWDGVDRLSKKTFEAIEATSRATVGLRESVTVVRSYFGGNEDDPVQVPVCRDTPLGLSTQPPGAVAVKEGRRPMVTLIDRLACLCDMFGSGDSPPAHSEPMQLDAK
eukprot:TRINITY_DN32371_c0_g1_i1.p1 TRINITY_DN32371_c0_g1~~TRINITY_DN32371_c0_g1_i1.p1  ORF type:complete len:1076 (+),score=156.81 TRINITY_DN32371_c0_g1_i1:83-3310(+)